MCVCVCLWDNYDVKKISTLFVTITTSFVFAFTSYGGQLAQLGVFGRSAGSIGGVGWNGFDFTRTLVKPIAGKADSSGLRGMPFGASGKWCRHSCLSDFDCKSSSPKCNMVCVHRCSKRGGTENWRCGTLKDKRFAELMVC